MFPVLLNLILLFVWIPYRFHLLISGSTPLYLLYKVLIKCLQSANKVLLKALCKHFIRILVGFYKIDIEEIERSYTC